MLTRSSSKKQKLNLISATRISNYVKSDTIVDYLDLLNEKSLTLNNNLAITRKRTSSIDFNNHIDNHIDNHIRKKKKSSFDYIVESGYIFEYDIIKQIEITMEENNELDKLIKINELNINLNCTLTMGIIKENKHSVILGSVLINKNNNTWGKPDLIVKGCWINKYIEENILDINVNNWYIIDIKSSTINLINGGEDLSSKLLYNVYKSQVYIYTDALNNSMKEYGITNDVKYGFILGRRYKYVLNKNIIIKKPFECLGLINFSKDFSNGIDWKNIISNAVKWINDLRVNWENFSVNPISRNELYPNMKNNYDKNWHKIKKQIALVNKEITLIWNCGISSRNCAWEHGIKRYDDQRLNSNLLGFGNSKKNIIIDKMLKVLHTNNNYILDKNNNYLNWQNESKWEFYVDFETYSPDSIYDETNDCDNCFYSNQKIYMIGISWIPESTLKHKSFILSYNDSNNLKNEFDTNKQYDDVKFQDCIFCSSEKDLIIKFKNFLLEFKPNNIDEKKFIQETRLYHWSSAEPVIFNKKIKEYCLDNDNDKYRLNWFDLLQVFKYDKYPIIIKECFGFGLKEIAKKLNDYNQITLTWSDLDDGLLSSFIARDIYLSLNSKSKSNNDMYLIIEYNYIDCKALFQILNWMRKVVSK